MENCNCVLSYRGSNTLELSCCDKFLDLMSLRDDKCPECGKTIVVFDTEEHAKLNGK